MEAARFRSPWVPATGALALGLGKRVLRSGFVPALLVFLAGFKILTVYEVSSADIWRYVRWLVYGIAVPGTLIWRALRGTPRTFLENVVCGTALGFAIEILLSIALRAVDAPKLIVWWPLIVIVNFLVAPPLRRTLKPDEKGGRTPPGFSWAIAACIGLVFCWFAFWSFRAHPLTGRVSTIPYVDIPYHLALAGEVKHHMPPEWPYVLGEPLHHHWFAHAEIAASSWATGVEVRTIMLRLQIFPFMALTVLLTALLAVRITRRWWPGAVAVLSAFFVAALSPYVWDVRPPFGDFRVLDNYMWQSPSSLVGAAIFAAVPILLLDRFRKEKGAAGQWILMGVLLAVCSGAKSTLIPLFLAGLGAAGLFDFVFHRRINPAVLLAGEIAAVLFVFSYFVLYGGSSYGMVWKPWATFRRLLFIEQLGLAAHNQEDTVPFGAVKSFAAIAMAGWFVRGAGSLGLLSRRERPRDPTTVFLGGVVVAGVLMLFLFDHPGQSQVYFLRSASPFIGVLAACGLAALVPRERRAGPMLIGLGVAAAAGALGAVLIAQGNTMRPLFKVVGSAQRMAAVIGRPMIFAGAMALAIAALIFVLRARIRWFRGVAAALTLAAVMGTGLPVTVGEFKRMSDSVRREGLHYDLWYSTIVRTIPEEGLVAGRWLRDHSRPSDVVATNQHCRYVLRGVCENRHFWISAYTERRVLVEGWGYTTQAMKTGNKLYNYATFPYPRRLFDNDQAFVRPSAYTIRVLRETYHVRWLFVDERYEPPAPALSRFATLRFRDGPCVVYELPPSNSTAGTGPAG